MTRIIKPDEDKVFMSARKFRKKPLVPESRPARGKDGSQPLSSSSKSDKSSKQIIEQLSPKDIAADAESVGEQKLRDAEQAAEEIRERARKEGFAKGIEEARKKTEEQLAASSRMISAFIDQMKEHESELARKFAPRLAELVTMLAEKVIHREIDRDSFVVTAQAEEAISKILEREKLIIRVNPSDEESMKVHKTVLSRMFDGVDKIEVVGDAGVEKGGCIVETNLVQVDAQPASQLELARQALLSETEK